MGGAGGMGWGWIWPVILLVGLAVLAWALAQPFRSPGRRRRTPPPPSRGAAQAPQGGRALEMLRERYARGEISEEEFHERMRALSGR